jgi:hypothetical protein
MTVYIDGLVVEYYFMLCDNVPLANWTSFSSSEAAGWFGAIGARFSVLKQS